MRLRLLFSGVMAVVLANFHAMAASAPAGLRGKSVIATWTETRVQRLGGMGEFKERAVSQNMSAYISSEGRVFAKRTVSGRRGRSGSLSSVGENAAGVQGAQFSGQSLIITNKFASGGVRMARISFDSGFSGCTATVILGRENGAGIARGRSRITGEALEIKSASVSNTNCSVRSGNVFGE